MHTKIQYKDFEPGEFTGEKDRTVEETIELISSFPWQDQRDHLVVSLTNPGITIEGAGTDFLKLAPYYNGKFVLHYLDARHHLFTRSFDHLEDSYPVIRAFFDTRQFDPTGFRREATALQQFTPHFVTNDFHYTISTPRIVWLAITASFLVLFIALMAFLANRQPIALMFLLPILILLLLGLALFINHYKAARGKVLIVSKGLDAFSFGPIDDPKTFYKHDIVKITTYGQRGRGGGYGPLTKVEIGFENGACLEISCLMLSQPDLIAKFPRAPRSEESQVLPFINRDASALFE